MDYITERKPVLPKKFRLNTKSKENIVTAALQKKYSKEANAIMEEEMCLLNCIGEYLYPAEKRNALLKAVSTFADREVTLNYMFTWTKSINVTVSKDTLSTLYSGHELDNALKLIPGNNRAASYGLGMMFNGWSLKNDGITYQLDGIGSRALKLKETPRLADTVGYWVPDRSFCEVASDEILNTIPKDMTIRVCDLLIKSFAFRAKVSKFSTLLSRTLSGYTSTTKLVETFPEFVPWIWAAHRMENPDAPRCSDIPLADNMQEVKAMLAA